MNELLNELEREFKRGFIVEAHILSWGEHVEGICYYPTGMIVVDPAPNVVDTLLHELLHRRYPRWGEKRVRQTANRLVRQMDPATVRRWYRRYQKAARKAKPIALGE
jgi:hypothetical protein